MGVSHTPLKILGVVCLPIRLRKTTKVMRMDFSVISEFTLLSDGLFGLESLKANNMEIHPLTSSVRMEGKYFRAMDQPQRLISSSSNVKGSSPSPGNYSVPGICVNSRETPTLPEIIPQHDITRGWKTTKATVIGNHEIPDRTAVHIPVSIPNVPVGCDVCLEGPSRVNKLTVEPTLNSIHEGNRTAVLIVNTSGGPIKLKQGVFLTQALIYDRKILPEALEVPATCVASVSSSAGDHFSGVYEYAIL